jgi:hypothetical protein
MNISEVLTPSIIAVMMEAAETSETSVNFYQTSKCNNPEDSHLILDVSQIIYMGFKIVTVVRFQIMVFWIV